MQSTNAVLSQSTIVARIRVAVITLIVVLVCYPSTSTCVEPLDNIHFPNARDVHHWDSEQVSKWFERTLERQVEDVDELQSNLGIRSGFELQQLLHTDPDALEARLRNAGLSTASKQTLKDAIELLKAQRREERKQEDLKKIRTQFGGSNSHIGFALASLVGASMVLYGVKLLLSLRTLGESIGALVLILTGSPLFAAGISTLVSAPLTGWILLGLIGVVVIGISFFKASLFMLRKVK